MKTRSSDLTKLYQSEESGQAAVVVALFLFFVFLALASLAIDGAITYLGRRDLQNVADAAALSACTDLVNNGTASSATITATRIITANLGSSVIFTPQIGSGTGLAQGIEISQPDVRVALRRPVPTVLTQFLGRGQSIIDAKAHCDVRAGGGLLPIAVVHVDTSTMRDFVANSAANSGNLNKTPPVPYPTDSVTVTVDGYYGPFNVPVPLGQYTASPTNPGAEVPLLGNAARANNSNSARGDVLLDLRNLAGGLYDFYNGATGNAQTNKDMSAQWIMQHGYSGPIPVPGSQVAVLKGVSAAFTAKTVMDAGYRVGDVIPVVIYDGFVWDAPDYTLNLTPNAANSNGITTGYPSTSASAAVYSLGIAQSGGAWQTPLNFFLAFSFSNGTPSLPPGTHLMLGTTDLMLQGLTYTVTNVTQASGWSGTLRIYSDLAGNMPPTQTVQYLSGLNLRAESNIGIVHSKGTNFGFTTSSISPADYALRSGSDTLNAVVRQGDTVTLQYITFGANSVPSSGCSNFGATATVLDSGGTQQPWSSYFSSSQTSSVSIARAADSVTNFSLTAQSNNLTGDVILRFTVPASTCGPAHSLDVPITILPAASFPNGKPFQFVVVQGYGLYRITDVDSNDVKGTSISPLLFDFSQITAGVRPRLVPWN